MPMMAITTNSSTSVNAARLRLFIAGNSTSVNARRARDNDDRIMDPPFPNSKSSACFALYASSSGTGLTRSQSPGPSRHQPPTIQVNPADGATAKLDANRPVHCYYLLPFSFRRGLSTATSEAEHSPNQQASFLLTSPTPVPGTVQ